MKPLETELRTFESNRPQLVVQAEGQFALVHDAQIIGTYASKTDAINEGYRRLGNVPFLIKQVTKLDLPQNFVSNLIGR